MTEGRKKAKKKAP